jgi:hypothetical protein
VRRRRRLLRRYGGGVFGQLPTTTNDNAK